MHKLWLKPVHKVKICLWCIHSSILETVHFWMHVCRTTGKCSRKAASSNFHPLLCFFPLSLCGRRSLVFWSQSFWLTGSSDHFLQSTLLLLLKLNPGLDYPNNWLCFCLLIALSFLNDRLLPDVRESSDLSLVLILKGHLHQHHSEIKRASQTGSFHPWKLACMCVGLDLFMWVCVVHKELLLYGVNSCCLCLWSG